MYLATAASRAAQVANSVLLLPALGSGWHWEKIHDYLRAEVRIRAGRKVEPSAGIADSQSVKTAGPATEVGFDGGKQIKGRKRQLVVDTLGLLLGVFVHSAGRSDQAGLKLLCSGLLISGQDCSCCGLTIATGAEFIKWVQQTTGLMLQPVKRPEGQKGFEVLPRRWVVERTFSWFNHYRRLSKDYEFLPTTSEMMIYVAMTRLMLRRLTRKAQVV
jgi:putative transposase